MSRPLVMLTAMGSRDSTFAFCLSELLHLSARHELECVRVLQTRLAPAFAKYMRFVLDEARRDESLAMHLSGPAVGETVRALMHLTFTRRSALWTALLSAFAGRVVPAVRSNLIGTRQLDAALKGSEIRNVV